VAGVMLFSAGAAWGRDFGLGASFGEPTGISGKAWTSNRTAVDFAMAWNLDNERDFNFHADYIYHDYGIFDVTHGSLPLYYGIGGRLLDANDTHLGLRGVIGLDYIFAKAPFDLFFEVAPVLDITPGTEMDFEGGFGFRFYFK
jgi:hypothetical protein